jgi:hypothetical protein
MIGPELLADRLRAASIVVERDGPVTWERVSDWTLPGRMPARGERGGGMVDAETDDRIDDRREDAAAARYMPELAALTKRLEADLARLVRIHEICNPAAPKNLATRDMLVAQVEADGWCGSCWRDDQHLTPVAERPNGVAYYRGRCRFCGEWKANTREDPPLDVLRPHHEGRRIRVKA